jgi:cytochrome P450
MAHVRISQVHFSESQAYFEIYSHTSKTIKDNSFYSVFHLDQSSLCFIDPAEAKVRRDIISQLFSRKAILQLQTIIKHKVSHLCDQWSRLLMR